MLLSGATDGVVAAWDVEFSTAFAPAWVAHTGGILALRADEARARGAFWSHGRDGCVHGWEWVRGAGAGAGVRARTDAVNSGRDDVDGGGGDPDDQVTREARELLSDMIVVGPPPAMRAVKMFTFLVGFGGFCALAALRGGRGRPAGAAGGAWPARLTDVDEESGGNCLGGGGGGGVGGEGDWAEAEDAEAEDAEAEDAEAEDAEMADVGSGPLLLLAAPAVDGAGIEIWDARRHERICIVRLPASAAAAAAADLLRGTPAEGAWAAAADVGEEGGGGGGGSSAAAGLARPGMPTSLSLVYDDDGDEEGGARQSSSSLSPSSSPPIVVTPPSTDYYANAAYENADGTPRHPRAPGGDGLRELLAASPPPAKQSTPPAPPVTRPKLPFPALIVAAFETGSFFLMAPVGGAEAADEGGVNVGTDGLVLATLRVSKHPLLAMALGPRGGIGVATAAGAIAYVFSLNVRARAGAVLRCVRLPAAGAAAAVMGGPGGGSALIGGWDGCARVIQGGGG